VCYDKLSKRLSSNKTFAMCLLKTTALSAQDATTVIVYALQSKVQDDLNIQMLALFRSGKLCRYCTSDIRTCRDNVSGPRTSHHR
jgi:hypothetical protein